MEKYLETLLSQIRCKKAHPYIAEEIRDHIESQIEDNLSEGMSPEEAEKCAVADMGDPLEAGISLDRIHRPRVAWKLLIMVGCLSLLGILLQWSLFCRVGEYDLKPHMSNAYEQGMAGHITAVLMGFLLMCFIYFLDYTLIAKYAKFIGIGILGLELLLITGVLGGYIHGGRYGIGFGGFTLSATTLMMLYVPLYGGILYKYRSGGVLAFVQSLVWLVVPVIIMIAIPNIIAAAIIAISMLLQLSAAILKGWFKVPRKKTLFALWSSLIVLVPTAVLFALNSTHVLKEYQQERLRAFFSLSDGGDFITGKIRSFGQEIRAFGDSGNDLIGSIPDLNSDYVFSYILNSYGILAGIVCVGILAALVMFIFGISMKQKNELGMVMGFGCGSIILFQLMVNVLNSVGAIPPTSSFLPFISVGNNNTILCYALMGIVLSIYKYKDVYPRTIKLPEFTLRLNLKF